MTAGTMQPAGVIFPEPWMRAPATTAVLAALVSNGDAARFVGGCVRDAVAERPVRDLDIATTGAPETNIRLLEAAGIRVIPTGLTHGTVTAVSGGRHFEVTTLRRDVETFGRHARVSYTDDWTEDARRRDFTINALYADSDGTLYDPTGGLPDLESGRVRFVGRATARIAEDYLRILRFFRFHAWYGRGPANRSGLRACAAAAENIGSLSGERIRQELFKLLQAPEPRPALRLMRRHGVLRQVLPGGADFQALSTLMRAERHGAPDPLLRLAALMRGQGRPAALALATRLRLANAERDRLQFVVVPPVTIRASTGLPAMRRAAHSHGLDRLADLAWLTGSRPAVARAEGAQVPRFPLRGRDALALGVAPGAALGELLAAVEAWWIAGDFAADRAACLARLEQAYRHSGPC